MGYRRERHLIGVILWVFTLANGFVNKRSPTKRLGGERAASAEKAAGEANERAAKAELEAAKLKSPRRIKDDQFAKMVAMLQPQKGKKFWIITERNDQDLGSEQMLLSSQLSRVFLDAGWIRDSHLSLDQSITEPESAVSDRGCNIALAADQQSLALRQLVYDALKSADLECVSNVSVTFAPEIIDIEIGLR